MTIEIASRDAIGLAGLSIYPPEGTAVEVAVVFSPPGTPTAGLSVARIELLPDASGRSVALAIAEALTESLRLDSGPLRIGHLEVPIDFKAVLEALRLVLDC